jgi:hypothetical protein
MLVDQFGKSITDILSDTQSLITKPVPTSNFQMYANTSNTPNVSNTPVVNNPNVVQPDRINVVQPDRINVVNPLDKYKHGGQVEILKGHEYIKDLL